MRSLAVSLLLTSACATILTSSTKNIPMDSSPSGARITIDGAPMGVTPTRLKLSNHKAHVVIFSKKGYDSIACTLDVSVGAGWVVLDVLSGLVPVIIDAVTGDWRTLDDTNCSVTLAPDEDWT